MLSKTKRVEKLLGEHRLDESHVHARFSADHIVPEPKTVDTFALTVYHGVAEALRQTLIGANACARILGRAVPVSDFTARRLGHAHARSLAVRFVHHNLGRVLTRNQNALEYPVIGKVRVHAEHVEFARDFVLGEQTHDVVMGDLLDVKI